MTARFWSVWNACSHELDQIHQLPFDQFDTIVLTEDPRFAQPVIFVDIELSLSSTLSETGDRAPPVAEIHRSALEGI